MRERDAVLLGYLAERHPSFNLQPRSLLSNRKGVRTLDEAEYRVTTALHMGRADIYGFTDTQWKWLADIPTWSLPEFLRSSGGPGLLVPVAHLADYWFHKLDYSAVSSMRRICLDLLGESPTLLGFLNRATERMGDSYGDDEVHAFLTACPRDGDQRSFAIEAAVHGPAVARLLLEGVPLEYAQAVAQK